MTAPQLVANDNLLNGINAALSELDARISNFDGAAIDAGSVANAALAKGKAFFTVGLCTDRDIFRGTGIGGVSVSNVWSWRIPNVDGASSGNWRYLGLSIGFQEFTTIHPAGALIRVRRNGAIIHDVTLSGVTAAGNPYQLNAASAVACTSGDNITVDYVAAATGDVQYATCQLHFSQQHVGT
jgi:hypothetical protein